MTGPHFSRRALNEAGFTVWAEDFSVRATGVAGVRTLPFLRLALSESLSRLTVKVERPERSEAGSGGSHLCPHRGAGDSWVALEMTAGRPR
jgi:hypothetical protein